MKCTFHHVGLKVTGENYEKTVTFYKEVLGLKERISWKGEAPACMLLMDDGGIIEIFGDGSPEDEQQPHWAHFAVAVDDVEAVYNKALEYGATPHITPRDTAIPSAEPLHIRIAFVKCPGGEILEFFKEL